MSTQGWMVQAAAFSYSGMSGSPDFISGERDSPFRAATNDKAHDRAESRHELLNRIKKQIKTGFYNSDAVIDDIGHGFAQALDQAL